MDDSFKRLSQADEAKLMRVMVSMQYCVRHRDGYFAGGAAEKDCGIPRKFDTTSSQRLVELWKALTCIETKVIMYDDEDAGDAGDDVHDYVTSKLRSLTASYCYRNPWDLQTIEPDMYPYAKVLLDFVKGPSTRAHQREMEILGIKPEEYNLAALASKVFTPEALKAAEEARKEASGIFMDKVKKGDKAPELLAMLTDILCIEYKECASHMPIGPTHRAYMKALCLFYCYEEAPKTLTGLVNKLKDRLRTIAPEKYRAQI